MRVPIVALALLVALAGCTAAEPTPSASDAAPATATVAPPSDTAAPTASASPTPAPTPDPEPLAWIELNVSGPAAREDHTWTVDGGGETAYLFGGRDGASAFGDLWAYDLADDRWAEVQDASPPPARFGHEAAWVDGIGLVIFAGQVGTTFFDDLWAFDPGSAAWRELPASGDVPVARYGSCASVGPDGRLWISHGFTSDGTRFADTVAYDFTSGTWTDETPDGDVPVSRCLHGCWWTSDGTLTLYAGQTTGVTALGDRWGLADGAWTRGEGSLPPDRNLYARARLDDATLVFGGQGSDGSYRADTWLLVDGEADAVRVSIAGPVPAARSGAELVRDAARDRLLLFGGRDGSGAFADLWELRGDLPAGR